SLKVETRFNAEADAGEAEAEDEVIAVQPAPTAPPAPVAPVAKAPTAPPSPTPDAAAFKERMKAVLPRVQQAAQKAPERKAELDKIAAQAAAAAKAGDFARGMEFVEQLATASTQAAAPPAAPPPAAPPPSPAAEAPATSGADAAAFKARLK